MSPTWEWIPWRWVRMVLSTQVPTTWYRQLELTPCTICTVYPVSGNNSISHPVSKTTLFFQEWPLKIFTEDASLLESIIKACQVLCNTLTYYPRVGINHSPGPEIQYILSKGCKNFRMHYSEVCKSQAHKLENLFDILLITESWLACRHSRAASYAESMAAPWTGSPISSTPLRSALPEPQSSHVLLAPCDLETAISSVRGRRDGGR